MERGTGSRLGLEDSSDIRIDGPIPHVVEQATQVIDELVLRRRLLAASGRFEAVPVVPRDVWLEGLVNAVIHRSYSLSGDHIRSYSARVGAGLVMVFGAVGC
jgi:ATP-dependent DNA helicase RecG